MRSLLTKNFADAYSIFNIKNKAGRDFFDGRV